MPKIPYVIQQDSPNLVIVPTEPCYEPSRKKPKLDNTSSHTKVQKCNKIGEKSASVNNAGKNVKPRVSSVNNNVLIDVSSVKKQQNSWASNFLQSIGGSTSKLPRAYNWQTSTAKLALLRNENTQPITNLGIPQAEKYRDTTQSIGNKEANQPKAKGELILDNANNKTSHAQSNNNLSPSNGNNQTTPKPNTIRPEPNKEAYKPINNEKPKIYNESNHVKDNRDACQTKSKKEVNRIKSTKETTKSKSNKQLSSITTNNETMKLKPNKQLTPLTTNKKTKQIKATLQKKVHKEATLPNVFKDTSRPKLSKETTKTKPKKIVPIVANRENIAIQKLKVGEIRKQIESEHDKKKKQTELNNKKIKHESSKSQKSISPIKSVVKKVKNYHLHHLRDTRENELDQHSRDLEKLAHKDSDVDLRSKLKRKASKNKTCTKEHQSRGNRKHNIFPTIPNSKSFVPDENLIISFKPENDEEEVVEKKKSVKAKTRKRLSENYKRKKIKLQINLIYQTDTDTSEDESSDCEDKEDYENNSDTNDLSFLDDFNVDEIAETLNNCQNSIIKINANIHSNVDEGHSKLDVKLPKTNDEEAVFRNDESITNGEKTMENNKHAFCDASICNEISSIREENNTLELRMEVQSPTHHDDANKSNNDELINESNKLITNNESEIKTEVFEYNNNTRVSGETICNEVSSKEEKGALELKTEVQYTGHDVATKTDHNNGELKSKNIVEPRKEVETVREKTEKPSNAIGEIKTECIFNDASSITDVTICSEYPITLCGTNSNDIQKLTESILAKRQLIKTSFDKNISRFIDTTPTELNNSTLSAQLDVNTFNRLQKDDTEIIKAINTGHDKHVETLTTNEDVTLSNYLKNKVCANIECNEKHEAVFNSFEIETVDPSTFLETTKDEGDVILIEDSDNDCYIAETKETQPHVEKTINDLTFKKDSSLDTNCKEVVIVGVMKPNIVEANSEPILILDTDHDKLKPNANLKTNQNITNSTKICSKSIDIIKKHLFCNYENQTQISGEIMEESGTNTLLEQRAIPENKNNQEINNENGTPVDNTLKNKSKILEIKNDTTKTLIISSEDENDAITNKVKITVKNMLAATKDLVTAEQDRAKTSKQEQKDDKLNGEVKSATVGNQVSSVKANNEKNKFANLSIWVVNKGDTKTEQNQPNSDTQKMKDAKREPVNSINSQNANEKIQPKLPNKSNSEAKSDNKDIETTSRLAKRPVINHQLAQNKGDPRTKQNQPKSNFQAVKDSKPKIVNNVNSQKVNAKGQPMVPKKPNTHAKTDSKNKTTSRFATANVTDKVIMVADKNLVTAGQDRARTSKQEQKDCKLNGEVKSSTVGSQLSSNKANNEKYKFENVVGMWVVNKGDTRTEQNQPKTDTQNMKDATQTTVYNKNARNVNAKFLKKIPNKAKAEVKSDNKNNETTSRLAKNTPINDKLARQLAYRMHTYYSGKHYVTEIIHRGSFSTIYQCEDDTGSPKTVKMVKIAWKIGASKENMMTKLQKGVPEYNFHCVHHFYGFAMAGYWCFIMEYYPKNLQDVMSANQKSFHIDRVQELSRQLVAAVTVLRNNNIIHSDIHPRHILVNETETRIKLCGFDQAFYYHGSTLRPGLGTVNYRAPELILGFHADYRLDVWATALVMYEMATNRHLFPGHFENDILYKQLCTVGSIPYDMLEQSLYRNLHFMGTAFVRTVGFRGEGKVIMNEFFKKERINSVLETVYHTEWAKHGPKQAESRAKVHGLAKLLNKMLVMDPRCRITIEFVFADPFIYQMSS